jgi:NAD(P)H-hydrate epimerase
VLAVIRDGVPIVQWRAGSTSRQAVHRWLRWYEAQGLAGLADRSRPPSAHTRWIRHRGLGGDPREGPPLALGIAHHGRMAPLPAMPLSTVPAITAEQMREVDRLMVEELGIDLVRMMENAGRNLASVAIEVFSPSMVVILAGPGGNGGGGMTAARHLSSRGVQVSVVLSHDEGRLAPVPAEQLAILRRIGVAIVDEPPDAGLIVDALIGYSLHGPPRDRTADLIDWANHSDLPILSLDLPSGLEATTGTVAEPCARATATMTLALPKTGLVAAAPSITGRVFLADIGVHPRVYERIGLAVPALFQRSTVLELTR